MEGLRTSNWHYKAFAYLYQLIAGDVDAKGSLSNLNIEELNLEELDKEVVEVTEEAKKFVNPSLPPSGLFPIFIFYFIF